MTIEKQIEKNRTRWIFEGRLDTQTAPQMEISLEEIDSECTELILDFKGLEYISSAGLRVVLKAQKRMNTQGTMKLENVNETVMEVFDMTGFLDFLTIE